MSNLGGAFSLGSMKKPKEVKVTKLPYIENPNVFFSQHQFENDRFGDKPGINKPIGYCRELGPSKLIVDVIHDDIGRAYECLVDDYEHLSVDMRRIGEELDVSQEN